MAEQKDKINKAIEAAGISRYQLFHLLEISEPTWYRWQREGFPKLAILALCHVLGVEEEAIGHG